MKKIVAATAALLIAACSPQGAPVANRTNETAAVNTTKPKPVRAKSAEEAFADTVAANDVFVSAAARLAEEKGGAGPKGMAKLATDNHNRSTMELKFAGKNVPGFFVDPSLSDEQNAKLTALQSASGPAFDAAFKADVVAAETSVLATLEKYRTSGSEMSLKTYAYLIKPKIEAVLAKARAL